MSKYRHHKYTYTNHFGSPTHEWELIGPIGAVSFRASLTPGYDPSCGLEFHHTEAAHYRCEEAPDHVNCPLTGGRCWHDGTSLYATETVWPLIKAYLRSGEHEQVFRLLEYEADSRFESFEIANRALRRAAGLQIKGDNQ